MSTSINLHRLKDVQHGHLSKIKNDVVHLFLGGGVQANLFVPPALAARFAQAWQDAKDAGEV